MSVLLVALPVAGVGAVPARASALGGRSMWIWYVSRSSGGNLGAIVARARAAGVRTLIVKSSDGSNWWSQFSPELVRRLHANGLHVCAWQYVYGTNPVTEASLGARATRTGAECLIIDAEAEYEGRYAAAQTYIRRLRRAVGQRYRLGLSSFPFVDYHPSFPYSVFLGPGGAQVDLPQMYWKDIATSPAGVFRHTYTWNRIYRRTIYPLGQTYGAPAAGDVQAFRGLTIRYRAPGVSWWDYAWTSAAGLWSAISGALSATAVAPLGTPRLGEGDKGDHVLWMQEHLARAFRSQGTTGLFGPRTTANLRAFQVHHRLAPTGRTDPLTWRALLRIRPVGVYWGPDATVARHGTLTGAAAAPASASLPARAYEIPEIGAERAPLDARLREP